MLKLKEIKSLAERHIIVWQSLFCSKAHTLFVNAEYSIPETVSGAL